MLHLREEVLEVEVRLAHLFCHAFGFLLVDIFLGSFNERDNVAHAKNTRGEAVGMEYLEVAGLFTGAGELDGDAGDGLDGERRATAGVSVHFGENEAGELKGVVEGFGDVDRLLAERAVGDEEDFVGLHDGAETFHFLNQILVDLETAGGVEDDDVGIGLGRDVQRLLGDRGDILGHAVAVETEFFLLGEDLKLVDGGGTINVARGDEGAAATLLEQLAEFGGGGGFARTMQTDHENFERALGIEFGGAFAEEGDQFVVDDFDDLLAGRDGFQDGLAVARGLDALDEFTGDLEMNVGGEEGGAHFLEGVGHVGLGQLADPAQIAEGGGEFFGQGFKHAKQTLE